MGGCIARGDIGTVQIRLAALGRHDGDAAALYRTLARRTVPLAIERGQPDRGGRRPDHRSAGSADQYG
jgi:predicted short-subunit dehydrogenase-like oxidoreductase (DUF2520 family)